MAKKKEIKKIFTHLNEDKVTNINIFSYCKSIMLIFGANVNIARAIPNGMDGLKPVEKRTLYCMAKVLNAKPGKFKKVQKISGEVIGTLHPHGDVSVSDSICSMGQWFSTPLVLVEKQGNFGTITGDSHAAPRYIEGSISKFTEAVMFKEWTPNIVDFKNAYTGEDLEPELLPTAIPLVLCKDIFGISYGASSSIPYYPLDEVVDVTKKLIKNPKAKFSLIPDSPTGCPIVDTNWDKINETGSGSFIFRGEARIDRDNNEIIIESIPHKTDTMSIMEKIIKLRELKKIDGIEQMLDETEDKDSYAESKVKLRIMVKKGHSPEYILDTIYKLTDLQITSVVKLDVVYNYKNYHVSMRSLILNWIENRRETKRRILSYEYSSVRREVHILDFLVKKILVKNGETKLSEIGRKSKNRADMVERLIKTFKLTDIQAEALADMKFYNLSKDDIDKYKAKLKEVTAEEKRIKDLLEDEEHLDRTIIKDMDDIVEAFNIPRMSTIIEPTNSKDVTKSKHIIGLTNKGFIKKLDHDYSGIGRIDEDDFMEELFKANNTDEILIFDDKGTVYNLPIYQIPDTGKSKGLALNKIIKCGNNKIIKMFVKPTDKELESSDKLMYLTFATQNGIVKKSLLKHYMSCGLSGIIGITLTDDDSLVAVNLVKGDKQIILYTRKGMYIKFSTDDISETQRVTKGVTGIKLAKEDKVVGLDILNKSKNYVVILTNKGNGKKCLLRSFDTSKRGVGGNTLIKLAGKEGISTVISARNGNILNIYTEEGIEHITVEEIPEMLKMTAGKKVLKLGRSNNILKVSVE